MKEDLKRTTGLRQRPIGGPVDTSWWRTPWTAKERSVIFFVRMGCNLGKGSQPDDSEVREDGKRVASGATSPQTPPPGALADRMADGHVPNKDSNALMSLDTHIEDQGLCFLGVYCHALHARFFSQELRRVTFLFFFVSVGTRLKQPAVMLRVL